MLKGKNLPAVVREEGSNRKGNQRNITMLDLNRRKGDLISLERKIKETDSHLGLKGNTAVLLISSF